MSTLIVTLPLAGSQAPTLYPYTLTRDGQQVLRHASASAALLPDPGRAGEVVAIVPAQALSWQRAKLPPGALAQKARLRSILHGLLEEQLLDDPQQLHFALPPDADSQLRAKPQQPLWLALCERHWLRQHLHALEAAGRPVHRIVPELTPEAASRWTLTGQPEAAYWLIEQPTAAPLAIAQAPQHGLPSLLSAPAQSLQLRAEPAVAALAEQLLARPAPLVEASERALEAARSPWNLAQADLASGSRQRLLRQLGSSLNRWLYAPAWRPARWALAVALLAQIAGLNLWAWQQRQALAAKQQAIGQVLTQTFRHIPVVVDAPLQMQRELARLRQASASLSPSDLESLLAAAASALPEQALAQTLHYQDGQLQLQGLTLSTEQSNALEQRLRALGYRAQVQEAHISIQAEAEQP